MIRLTSSRLLLAAVALFAIAGPAVAQRPKLEIKDIRVGLPPGRFVGERDESQQAANVLKQNTWAPVYLRLEMLAEYSGPAKVKIETVDADDLRTSITYPLGNFTDRKPGEQISAAELPFLPYVRFGERGNGEITVTITTDEPGTRDRQLAETKKLGYLRQRDPLTYVVCTLGSNLPGFDLPKVDNPNAAPNFPGGTRGALRNGRVETAAITAVREMPDQWFGYAAADVVVLPTGAVPAQFLSELFGDGEPGKTRRAALLEWVRRGGKLIVSVGGNAGLMSQFPAFQDILPMKLAAGEPSRGLKELPLKWQIPGARVVNEMLRPKADTFPVARLAPNKSGDALPPRTLIPAPNDNGEIDPDLAEFPAVVQVPFGLGKITLVTFDLDRSPFLDFPPRLEFWDWLLRAGGAERASGNNTAEAPNQYGFSTDKEDEFATELRSHVDWFEGVPVISFGWVALFIALYTLLIGPVEYLFLKKVVGRLELTWITFPLIVLSVSAAAYFTAYAIKGNDLRINKVDVADIDPASGRIYGRSWFTLFSPRIDSYTIGVEPREGWAVAHPGAANPPTLVDWMAGSRGGGGNIVSRGYAYHADAKADRFADGLIGVPIQVWSTKAFTANWSGYLDPGTPLVESRLYHPPGDRTALQGSFVNRLPIRELQNVALIYAGKVYKLDTLVPGQTVIPVRDPSTEMPNWFAESGSLNLINPDDGSRQWRNNNNAIGSNVSLWGALFHERAAGRQGRLMNSSLRDLDQSWRAGEGESAYRDEAILVARVAATNGPAESLMTETDGPSVTKLWLNTLPGGSETREPIPGVLRQETYIRVYLPVRAKSPAAAK